MTSQIPGHQPPGETSGAEQHDVELTVSAHRFILSKPNGPGSARGGSLRSPKAPTWLPGFSEFLSMANVPRSRRQSRPGHGTPGIFWFRSA